MRLSAADSLDLETGGAGRVQVSRFQRNTKCIGADRLIDRSRADAGPRAQNQEIPGISGGIKTQIVVEAETIFDVPANGIYYANLVVTGVPVIPPTNGNSAKLPNGPPPFD